MPQAVMGLPRNTGTLSGDIVSNSRFHSMCVGCMAGQADKQSWDDLLLEEAKPKLRKPPLYKVFLLNDDFTPMEFVVAVLKTFFNMDDEKATQVMLHVHTKGIGVCGVFSKDIAETKVRQVNDFSRNHQHPLLCDFEEA
jgi:ATP-dependent Clp protease adaptor protein ClpS